MIRIGLIEQEERRDMSKRPTMDKIRENQKIAISMYKQGSSAKEIGAVIGYSAISVNNMLRYLGVKEYKKRKNAYHDGGQRDPGEGIAFYRMAQDRRKIRKVEEQGKKYQDVTDFYAGI